MTELPVAGGQGRAGSGQVARAPDYAGAYSSSGQRSRVHVHWCSLIGIFGVNIHAEGYPVSCSLCTVKPSSQLLSRWMSVWNLQGPTRSSCDSHLHPCSSVTVALAEQ